MFIITDKVNTSRGGGKRFRCYKDEEVKLEEIEVSHTLGGYWSVRFTGICFMPALSTFLKLVFKPVFDGKSRLKDTRHLSLS